MPVLLVVLGILTVVALALFATGMFQPGAVLRGRWKSRRNVLLFYGVASLSLAVFTLMAIQAGNISYKSVYKKVQSLSDILSEKKTAKQTSAKQTAELNAKKVEDTAKTNQEQSPAGLRDTPANTNPPAEEKTAGPKNVKERGQPDVSEAAAPPPAQKAAAAAAVNTTGKTTAARPVPEEKKTAYADLNGNLSNILFFEAGYDPPPKYQRVYKKSFYTEKTRYVYWEANFNHDAPARLVEFPMDAVYHNSRGEVVARQTMHIKIEPSWENSNHCMGWGAVKPGWWAPGSYRVDLFIDGVKVGSSTFDIL